LRIKKTVYTQSFDTAREKGELEKYHESRRINADCATAVYQSIADSNYAPNHYNLESAVRKVLEQYGEKRVSWVTANTIQYAVTDGRYSRTNKEWAKCFDIPQSQRESYLIRSHPCLVDGFADGVRKVCAEIKREAALARAEKRGNLGASPVQAKPTLAERLDEGRRKAAAHDTPHNESKSKYKEARE
jgi:hypothetical protein